MKTVSIGLFLFCANIFSIVHAQNVKVVDYMYRDGTVSGVVPFDQHFVMNITQIPDINSFTLKIYEIKKYDYKLLKKNNPGYTIDSTVSMELIKKNKHSLAFSSKELIKNVDYKDSNCRVQITAYLNPNSRYIFEMVGINETPISVEEKEDVKKRIQGNFNFKKIINNEISKNILNIPGASATSWRSLTTDLTKVADAEIKAINNNYIIKGDRDFAKKFDNINTIFIKNIEVLNQINWIYEYYKDTGSNNINFADTQLLMKKRDKLIRTLSLTDWASINTTDLNSIITDLDNLVDLKTNLTTRQKERLYMVRDKIKLLIEDIILAKNDFINTYLSLKIKLIFIGGTAASTYVPDFKERAKQHVTFDLGYAYIWGIDRTNAYAGLDIYFRAVDTSLPLINYRANFKDYMGSHFSLLIGTSLESIQKDSVRRGLLGNGAALVTGIGYKLLPWFKINTGAYLYYKYPQNPLINKDRLTFTGSPFVSFSIDINLSSLFNSFGNGNVANVFKSN